MLDSGGSEGGNPQMVKAMQAQKSAQSAQSLSDLSGGSGGALGGGGDSNSMAGGLSPQMSQALSGGAGGAAGGSGNSNDKAQPPREIGSIQEELLERPLYDMGQEVKSWFNINEWFGIKNIDSPEEQQRKTQLHTRYQQLSKEQQQYFQARLKREDERKHRMDQEKQSRDRQKAAEDSNEIQMPTGPQRGESGSQPKNKAKMMTKLIDKNRQNPNVMQSTG